MRQAWQCESTIKVQMIVRPDLEIGFFRDPEGPSLESGEGTTG